MFVRDAEWLKQHSPPDLPGSAPLSVRLRLGRQGIIVSTVMIATAASLWAVGLELSLAKDAQGYVKDLRVVLAITTVALSWVTSHLMFALHYAHEYYAPDKTTPEEDDVIGGLQFPGGEEPDNWDFFHFAIVIGVANQTADVAFTNKRLRRIGTVHGLISFVFNTAVLALSINLLAGCNNAAVRPNLLCHVLPHLARSVLRI